MNSRQRRKDRRIWKFQVKHEYIPYELYSEMWEWLKVCYGTNVHKCGWRDRITWDHLHNVKVTWEFTNEKDANWFALKWLSLDKHDSRTLRI